MARASLLGCLDKREILNQPAVSVETLVRWGKVFSEAGLIYDAMDFYEKAGAQELMRDFLALAQEEGNVFLYKRVCKALKIDPDVDQWLILARTAGARELHRFAAEAFRMAGVDDASPDGTSVEGQP